MNVKNFGTLGEREKEDKMMVSSLFGMTGRPNGIVVETWYDAIEDGSQHAYLGILWIG